VTSGRGWRITTGIVESDPECCKPGTPEFDCLLAELVISNLTLNDDALELREEFVEAAKRRSSWTDFRTDVILHSALGIRSGQ